MQWKPMEIKPLDREAVFFYSDELADFEYGATHPFKPIRAKLTIDLCRRYDLMERPWIRIVNPEPLDHEDLVAFHDESYLRLLKAVESESLAGKLWPDLPGKDVPMRWDGEFLTLDPQFLKYGLGTEDCPVFPGVYDFAVRASGGTLAAVKMVSSGEAQVAFNPLGGFHHAGRDHAEGFCYINDVAVAITHLLQKGLRVAFVDIDAHHCNGVQDAFYGEDRALIISLHESGKELYPWSGFENEIGEGKGKGYTVNLPVPPETDDEIYVRAFNEIVPPLLDAFRADLVIAELGADTHVADPLTNLLLTNFGYCQVVQKLVEHAPRLVGLGGGGYDVFKTARNWTLAWGLMNRLEPRDVYAGIIGGMMFGPEKEAGSLHDQTIRASEAVHQRVGKEVDRVVEVLKKTVFPFHKI